MTGIAADRSGVASAVLETALGVRRRSARSGTPSVSSWTSRYRRILAGSDTAILLAIAVTVFEVGGATPKLLIFAVGLVLVWSFSLEIYRSRDRRVIGTGPSEYKDVLGASMFTLGVMAAAGLAIDVEEERLVLLIAFPGGTFLVILSRWLWRQWLIAQRARGGYLSRVLVVGPEQDVRDVARRLEDRAGGYLIVGAVIDGHEIGSMQLGWRDVPVTARRDGIVDSVRLHGADTVIVAGHYSGDNEFVKRLAWSLEDTATEMVLASGLTDVAGPRIHMRPVEGLPLMHVELPTFEGGKHLIKRTFDIVLSGVALLVLLPVLLVIGFLVRRDSDGPALFLQERVGKDGRTFRMLKFRSMVQTAEADLAGLLSQNEGAGVLFKVKADPRVTNLGRVLRKHSLDELPQLWNIFIGDMSIVGPRPPLQREVNQYEQDVQRRLFINPGLTGLWQISGRSDLSWEESVRLDLYYVENWSLAGDLVIMWRTVKVLLGHSGAY